jgi:hypothetical protein
MIKINEMERFNMGEKQQLVINIKEIIEDNKKRIAEYFEEMSKAMKKSDLGNVKFYNNMMARQFENIAEWERRLVDAEFEAKIEKLQLDHPGFEIVVDVLNEMLADDIKWHKELKAQYKEDRNSLKGATKTTMAFARMGAAEAEKIFRNDLEIRFYNLVKQIKDKVGELKEAKLDRNDNGGFDGYAIGENGMVNINTIVAGGYNIQRAHYRTLVK